MLLSLPSGVVAGDLDQDRRGDAVVGEEGATTVSYAAEDGSLVDHQRFSFGLSSNEALLLDLNHDGLLDVVRGSAVALSRMAPQCLPQL